MVGSDPQKHLKPVLSDLAKQKRQKKVSRTMQDTAAVTASEKLDLIRIELDAIRRPRGPKEVQRLQRARWRDVEVIGNGFIVEKICAAILKRGIDPETPVEIYRDGTLCFTRASLHRWAERKALNQAI